MKKVFCALLAALTLLAGCAKNNDTEDKNTPDTDPAQEIVLVRPEAADVPVDFETAQKAWPDAYAYMKIPNATGCAIREGGFIAQHPGTGSCIGRDAAAVLVPDGQPVISGDAHPLHSEKSQGEILGQPHMVGHLVQCREEKRPLVHKPRTADPVVVQ